MECMNPDPGSEIYQRLMKWRLSQNIAASDRKQARCASLQVIDETIVFLARQYGRTVPAGLLPEFARKKAAR